MRFIGRLTGRPGKVAYGSGNLGVALIFHTIGAYLIYFYANEVRLDPTLLGLAFTMGYGVWNSINDPVAGYVSDRTMSRWGRRIPYVLFGTPLLMLSFIMLWHPPVSSIPLSNPYDIGLFIYLIIVIGVFELIYTFVTVGWNSLFPEMFQDLSERAEVAMYRQIAAMVGVVMAFVITPQVIDYLAGVFGRLVGWLLTATIVSLVSGGAFFASLLGSREKRGYSAAAPLPIASAFKTTLTNASFITAALAILTISWIWSLLSAMAPFFVQYMLGGTIGDVALISAPLFVSGFAFYPFWRMICVRLGAKATLTISTTTYTVLVIILFMAVDNIMEAMGFMVLVGLANSGVGLTRELLVPDVIDEDELKTGFRREGIYLGVTTFVDRFALSLTGVSTAIIFGITGFKPGSPQPPQVALNMRILTSLMFVIALAIFLTSMKYYPLGKGRIREVRGMIERLRREREMS